MTSELKVDKITPASGTNTQIGEAGDTTNLSAGTVTLPTSIITGQSEKTSLPIPMLLSALDKVPVVGADPSESV